MTMTESWGYHKADDAWKTPKQIVRNLVACARHGGNYLLNIGPKPDGSIPEESVRILNAVARWMDSYGDPIYRAEPCAVRTSFFANFTRKANDLCAYVHLWPGSEWGIGDPRTKVKSAKLLPGGKAVELDQDGFRVRFRELPAHAPGAPVSVLELECESVPTQDVLVVRKESGRGRRERCARQVAASLRSDYLTKQGGCGGATTH